ncbi:MAG TPA: hypothetical protein VGC66_03715 [Pyrinomonadaceae bacterium]
MKRIGVILWCFFLCGLLNIHSVVTQGKKTKGKQSSEISELVGNWSGESVCVDKEKFPACHDEQVIYRIAKTSGKSDTLTITMDKIVNNKPETMGVFDFVYNAQKQTLSSEFTRNKWHGIWEFVVKGDLLEGTLAILPDKVIVRRIKVKKDK